MKNECITNGGILSMTSVSRSIEKEHYEKVLEVFGGNVTSTAKSMGISRSTMYRKMKNHGIKHIRKLK